ncbi:MAG: 4-hydroxythreonine-4-phosphate dehydrogenase PdxA [Deltaproteobacteria bacterium]|nr:4-hydroxythreonine-4-phosphate dehydrogenase PdxA [Deltaproteobacteria bacterium]
MKPIIGILLGDATGIGPEIVAKVFATDSLLEYCRPLLIGDIRVLESGKKIAQIEFSTEPVETISQATWDDAIPLLDQHDPDPSTISMGTISADAGRATGKMLIKAMEFCRRGEIAGVTFAPYNKAAMEYGGYPLSGLFTQQPEFSEGFVREMNVVGNLWSSRVTSHIPLIDVPGQLSMNSILETIRFSDKTLRRAGFDRPRVAVAALNPHGGEDGLCGREEIEKLAPAVKTAQDEGIQVTGPFPADTLFFSALKGKYDCIVTLYHDQGQIALKLLNFETIVSVLAGLPYPMTTPAHGTAFDIAGKGIANPEAMKQAVIIAAAMTGWKRPR